MAASEAYGNWDQFQTLAKLDFVIHGTPENQTTKIYANSNHMVEAIITVELLDKNGKKVNVSDDDLKKQLYFCRFETGENLSSSWLISDDPNEYVIDPSEKSSDAGTIRYAYKYISRSKHEFAEITEKISVGINIPGVGKFDTSRNGTSTKQKSGHVFHSPKSNDITAIRPIDYGIHDNIKIECGEFETIKDDLNWATLSKSNIEDHYNGQCKRRVVYIRPNQNLTGQEKFKKHEIVYDPIDNKDVSTGQVPPIGMRNFDGFSLISDYATGAVMGRGWGRNDYEVNLWYKYQSSLSMYGGFWVADDNAYYQFSTFKTPIRENHIGEDEHGAATLLLFKLIMPLHVPNKWQCEWQNVIRNITVKVTDFYGNQGSFQLAFNEDKFDVPGLK